MFNTLLRVSMWLHFVVLSLPNQSKRGLHEQVFFLKLFINFSAYGFKTVVDWYRMNYWNLFDFIFYSLQNAFLHLISVYVLFEWCLRMMDAFFHNCNKLNNKSNLGIPIHCQLFNYKMHILSLTTQILWIYNYSSVGLIRSHDLIH